MKKIILSAFASIISLVLIAQTYTGRNTISPLEKLNNEYATGAFKTSDGTIFDITNDVTTRSYLNIIEWLQGRVAGLQVYYQKDRTPVAFIRNSRAALFIDEMPVEPGDLNHLIVSDIAMIKVIKGPFVMASGNGSGGAIAIYTIKADDEEDKDDNK